MSVKLIAYYLPQYHPIPENDAWWGKGFTEWTNVAKAKPLFKGHYQPRLPADLGFYDLRVPEVREQQAELAREHGIYGFCYYHYWFGNGKQLLERPFNEVLATGKPDFPFMLCWANETWQGVWHGASKGKVLIEQKYPGKEDYVNHFKYLIKAFSDPRYITIDDKPVFNIYRPLAIPDCPVFVETFRECAKKAGFSGIYLLASQCPESWNPYDNGFDGVISSNFHRISSMAKKNLFKNEQGLLYRLERKIEFILKNHIISNINKPYKIKYSLFTELISNWPETEFDYFPQIIPDWDNSARSGSNSLIIMNSTPELWEIHLKKALDYANNKKKSRQIIFIKSWNEWAEGNYLEPCCKWGYAYLSIIQKLLTCYQP